jgi:hypothetical protein
LLFRTDSCFSSTESGALAGALPAQLTRSDVEQTSDVVGEVAGVGETYRHGDLCYGKVGAQEQCLRPLDALLDHVLVRGESGDCLERAGEVVRLMCTAPAMSSSVSFPGRLSFM